MAATNAQQAALADSYTFRNSVKASAIKKAINILENQGSFSASQITKAKSVTNGGGIPDSYYACVAGSTNVVASNITYDFVNRTVVSDISDASLDSQVATTVYTDLL